MGVPKDVAVDVKPLVVVVVAVGEDIMTGDMALPFCLGRRVEVLRLDELPNKSNVGNESCIIAILSFLLTDDVSLDAPKDVALLRFLFANRTVP